MLFPTLLFQTAWDITEAVLWAAGAVMLIVLLGGAFAVVLLRRRDWLGKQLATLDRLLARRTPRLWRFIRHRFSRDAWYGLALTASAVLCLSMIFLFAEITDAWIDQEALYRIDLRVNRHLRGIFSESAIRLVAIFTDLGGTPVAVAISVGLGLWFIGRRAWWRLMALGVTMGAGTGIMWTLKGVFGRARPDGLLATPTSASFPSGHAFTATVLYGFLLFLVWRETSSRPLRLTLTGLLVLLIVLIGLSRILLGVHWVSDVLGGFTIGLAWLIFGLVFTRAVQAYATDEP